MTRNKLKRLNYIANDMDILQHILSDISMLQDLSINCNGGIFIRGADFKTSTVISNICDKLKPIIEEELERLNNEFAKG